ncbi:MAG: transferase, partial [Actinomycetota bacterium]|nr:transferase [Actinomycetota bacterium]
MTEPLVAVVMPTLGRASLAPALAPLVGRLPVVVVDDRPGRPALLGVPAGVTVVRSGGRGP